MALSRWCQALSVTWYLTCEFEEIYTVLPFQMSLTDGKKSTVFIGQTFVIPADNAGVVVGEDLTPYGVLTLCAVNGLPIVCWDVYIF